MDSKGMCGNPRDQRPETQQWSAINRCEKPAPYISGETYSLKKHAGSNNLLDDKAIKFEDRRTPVARDAGVSNKKSNFDLFGFFKSMRDSSSKNMDTQVVAPVISQGVYTQEDDVDSAHSSGDEKLSKAFGVDLSYTRTPRVNSEQHTDSIELDNPDIEKSMLTDELRTLKFCLNDDEEDCDVDSLSRPKNALYRNSQNYSGGRRSTMHETSLNPASVIVIKNKKEASLLSTQDSRKVAHNSSHKNINSIYLKDLNETDMGGLSTVHEQGETLSNTAYIHQQNYNYGYNNNYNMFETEEDKKFTNNIQEAQSFYFSHYVPNIDMSLIKGVGHSSMSHGYYSRYAMDQSSESKKQKKGKRNFWKVEDTSEFDILPETIYKERKSTLMVRNIPNKYTKELMLETLDEEFKGAYDFFYLPIDFKNNCNVGYAFINFKDLKYIEPFYKRFNNKKWAIFNSEKICSIKYARIQGKEECERHFRDSSLMKQPVR